jgi:HK97 gp10 family phage protein
MRFEAGVDMSMTIDTTDFDEMMRRARLTESDLLNIEGAGAAVLVNAMRTKVPVDTGATRASVMSHIVSSSNIKVEDDIGPETNYAPYLEYGTKRMRAQSFVRPAAYEKLNQVVSAISHAYAAWASNL